MNLNIYENKGLRIRGLAVSGNFPPKGLYKVIEEYGNLSIFYDVVSPKINGKDIGADLHLVVRDNDKEIYRSRIHHRPISSDDPRGPVCSKDVALNYLERLVSVLDG